MGTPDFAAAILGGLVDAGHRLRAVYTQPPRPAGRGHRLQSSPVQLLAERIGLSVRSPASLRDDAAQAEFAAIGADAAVVAAYGLILPPPLLAAPRLGRLHVPASLFPRWSAGCVPSPRRPAPGSAAAASASGCCAPRPKRRRRTCRPAPSSTTGSASLAAAASFIRCGCSGRGAPRSTPTRFCAAFRSRPGPCCRAPLQADNRI